MSSVTRPLSAVTFVVFAGSVPPQNAQPAAPAEGTRHAYFAAIDRAGDPVPDLAASEVRVRVDGEERQVIAVERASAPIQVALLVDDSGAGLRFIREGTGAFIQRLGGRAEMSLTSTGGKNTMLVDFTTQVNESRVAVCRRLQPSRRRPAEAEHRGFAKRSQGSRADRPRLATMIASRKLEPASRLFACDCAKRATLIQSACRARQAHGA